MRIPASQKPILIVEDDPDDSGLYMRAIEAAGLRNRVYLCANGNEAVDLLRGEGLYRTHPVQRPALIILDLRLPGTDGGEVLRRIKRDPALRSIPVVVFTADDASETVSSAYAEGANCFIRKPFSAEATAGALRQLTDYWFDLAELPR